MTQAYPLSWPFGWKRTAQHQRQRAKFSKKETVYSQHGSGSWRQSKELTVANSLQRLFSELDRLRASSCIVSTNIETRLDGTPRSDRRAPDDPGVAVYFKLQGKDRVLACDKWDRVADNIAAIAAHIDAIRRQDRYGVGTLDQAFAGYAALPAPGSVPKRHWYQVLGILPSATIEEIKAAFKDMAKRFHPDQGGNHDQMAEINAAYQEAITERAAA